MLVVRDGKGRKDRKTVLPAELLEPLRRHLEWVRTQHDKHLADGRGAVTLPDALARKYPRAPWAPGWQWVFPAAREYVDIETGTLRRHYLHPTVVQRAFCAAVRAAGIAKPATSHASGTPSPPTCWSRATTSAPSRSCSAIGTSPPR